MPDKPVPPNDRIQPRGPTGDPAPGPPEPTFTLVKIKAVQKPPMEEELVAPPGGTAPPCACNSVCACVPVQQCGCDSVCTCDAVSGCDAYQSPCYSCWVVCIRFWYWR
jgi:hypothetical protein